MANPVRIYVLHHPDSTLAPALTDRLYDWFRMPSLEGIPVYLRSALPDGKDVPLEPFGRTDSLEYIVPLVDAHMVRDVAWHDYLVGLLKQCLDERDQATRGWFMFPVALDGTAFNLPKAITQRNFVRYMPTIDPNDQGRKAPPDESSTVRVLKDLTEAMSLDLSSLSSMRAIRSTPLSSRATRTSRLLKICTRIPGSLGCGKNWSARRKRDSLNCFATG